MLAAGHLIGHKDWSPGRKSDPGPFLVDTIRDWSPTNTPTQEDVNIVEAATKTYLDGKFAEIVSMIRATGGRLADVQKEGIDGRALILAGLEGLDPTGVSDSDLQRMGAIVAEMIPVLAAGDVVDALAARPLSIGPAA